jgi:Tfp pilus assembly protein PilF
MMHSHNHLERADELRQLRRYDLALQEIQRALALDPHASAPHVSAAWILRDQKRLRDAEQAARTALAAAPDDADAQHILAVTLWEQGRREEARQAFEAVLALVGGRSALYLTNYARMMTSYRGYSEALALAPSFADPHEIRGLALRRPGRFDHVVFVAPPDEAARSEILRLHLRGKPAAEDVDVARLARETEGFSGADLRALVDGAAALQQALRSRQIEPLSTALLQRALRDRKASTVEWLSTAKNYALYSNEGGLYDDVATYLRKRKLMR